MVQCSAVIHVTKKQPGLNMILINGDTKKINPEVLARVEEMERAGSALVKVTLQEFRDIFVCNVELGSADQKSVVFTSFNAYQKDTRELIFNMQDGKVSGFIIEEYWVDARREFPQCPEDLASEILFDLFIQEW